VEEEGEGGWVVVVNGCKLRKRERKLGRGVAWTGSGAEVVEVIEDLGTKRDLSRKSWVRGRRLDEDLGDSTAAVGVLK